MIVLIGSEQVRHSSCHSNRWPLCLPNGAAPPTFIRLTHLLSGETRELDVGAETEVIPADLRIGFTFLLGDDPQGRINEGCEVLLRSLGRSREGSRAKSRRSSIQGIMVKPPKFAWVALSGRVGIADGRVYDCCPNGCPVSNPTNQGLGGILIDRLRVRNRTRKTVQNLVGL